jgi:hypothetical protein
VKLSSGISHHWDVKKLLLLALLSTALIQAASWDGTRGNITLTTFSPAAGQTTFTVSSTNPSATAIRIKLAFSTPDGELTGYVVKTVDLIPRRLRSTNVVSSVSFTLPIDQATITGAPQITELSDGDTVSF